MSFSWSASCQIVALNSAEYSGGAHCFEMITITINGKSTQAQITDECPGCATGGLDLKSGSVRVLRADQRGPAVRVSFYYYLDSAADDLEHLVLFVIIVDSDLVYVVVSTPTSLATASTPSSSTNLSPVPTFTPQDPQILVQIDVALIEFGLLLQGVLSL
ncbi:hypothetical protein BU15DRAFT_73480 [Melanogaster broomeanus]|nr:hypothetical protein BU15DRAFT_73480 [Melanogaster broomeanus]